MSGGKETPRQKMVGLMYLVLLALLAMNVSKAVLDAFVAIEKNIQVGAVTQMDRGDSAEKDLKEELNDKTNPAKVEKVKYYLTIVSKINKIAAERIEEIDNLKVELLGLCGEDVKTVKPDDHEKVIWVAYDKAKAPLKPAVINLMGIQAKDQYDIPMHTIIGENLEPVTGVGKELFANYCKYRNDICDIVGTYAPPGGKSFTFKSKAINTFANNQELEKQVDKMMDANKTYNAQDDREVIKQIYMSLSKNEFADMEEEKHLHWIARTFDHSPIVAAIASLTALEQEVLAARASAISHIKSRVSTGEYSFNKVMPLAFGPGIANSGDEVEVNVMMAAFDSDNQPIVTGPGAISVADGKGTVKVKVSGGAEMVLNGTVAVKKKSGEMKTEKWTHTIKIMKPQGTVSLPEMNVMYRGYKNVVQGVASGYDQTVLTGSGVTLTKTATGYIGNPGAGRTCEITVAGKNSITNKTVTLGKFPFRVSNLPAPQVFLGTIATGSSVGKSAIAGMTKLFAKYPPEIPLSADFAVSSWEISVAGAPKSASGSGSGLTPEAMSLIKQAKPGSKVSISAKYKGMGYAGNMASIINVQ